MGPLKIYWTYYDFSITMGYKGTKHKKFAARKNICKFFERLEKTPIPMPLYYEGVKQNREVMNMEKGNPYSFYVVLADGIMEIPQDSNLSWITLFYALPRELVEKRPAYLEFPRNIHQLLHSEKYRKMIQSDAFLEFVWDCYAWAAWQFFRVPAKGGTYRSIPGDWSNYSGDFPLWRLSYEIIKHFRNKFETDMEWSFQRLFLMGSGNELPWLSYQHFSNLVGNLTDMIVEEQDWQPMIDEIWNNRQVADYAGRNINKRDFMRTWDHSRTAEHISLEDMLENGTNIDGEQLYEIPDPRSEFETEVLAEQTMEQFKDKLTEQDKQILQLRYEGDSLKEIAEKVGFKSPSAVSKRIEKLASAYEDFVSEEYSDFLDKHTT